MDKPKILAAIKQVKEQNGDRKFKQSIDLAINLKEFDPKKESIDEYIILPGGRGKPAKICALVGAELKEDAEKSCDFTIINDNFKQYDTPRKVRKLARQYTYFLGQSNLMPEIAKTFGRYFGPAGKMPSPKAGQIISPKTDLNVLATNLKKTIRLQTKKSPVMHCALGLEDTSEDVVAENALFILDRLGLKLPRGKHNIANLILKTTMGKGVKLE